MNHIYVQDVNDPASIVEAFQEALNRVVTVENIDRLAGGEFVVHLNEFVRIDDSTMLGYASIFPGTSREDFVVFVTLTYPMPDTFTSRAFIRVGQTNVTAPFSFEHQKCSAFVNVPTEWLRADPHVWLLLM